MSDSEREREVQEVMDRLGNNIVDLIQKAKRRRGPQNETLLKGPEIN